MRTWLFSLFSSCINRTILVLTWSHPCKLSCPATSHSSLPPNPRSISPALSRQLTCIYIRCMQLQSQTCSVPQACTTAAWGLLALLQLPFLQSLYICIFTKLQPLPELPLYIFLQGLVRLVHLYACTAPRAHHSCTSTRAPQLMHPYVCTSTRALHLVNLISCTSRASLHVHLYVCTSTRAPLRMHLILCAPLRAPHLACTPRASFALMHQATSCTHQAHPSSHLRGTWTIPVVTV